MEGAEFLSKQGDDVAKIDALAAKRQRRAEIRQDLGAIENSVKGLIDHAKRNDS